MTIPENAAVRVVLSLCAFAAPAVADEGIADRYPGDKGIESDPDVVFVEKFDAGTIDAVLARWESVQEREILALSTEVPEASADGASLLMTHRGGRGNGAHLYRQLRPGYDELYVRFYTRFDRDCFPIHHFFHVGGYNPATAWPQGGAGVRPRGDERFTVGIEPHGRSWNWDYYAYWMEMGGSPPRGQTWGNSFIRDEPRTKVARDRWTCMELRLKVNDVGESNGEMALWIDGERVSRLGPGFPKGKRVYDKFLPGEGGDGVRWSDEGKGPVYTTDPPDGRPFEGFRWRTDERLDINFLWVLCYITKAPEGHVSKVWFDNIVVAKRYIGPIRARTD